MPPLSEQQKQTQKKYRERARHSIAERKKNRYNSVEGRLGDYKSSAKQRGIGFNLTKEEFSSYWQLPCEYCGRAITTIGLDRVDSSVGYTMDNIVSCCTICNKMKLAMTKEEWLDNMLTILKHQGVI